MSEIRNDDTLKIDGGDRPRVLVSIVAMACEGFIVDCVRALLAGAWRHLAIVVVENGGAKAFSRLEAALVDAGLLSPQSEEHRQGAWRLRISGAPGADIPIILCDPGGNLGYAGGNNVALHQTAVTDWDAAWILNPDTIPEPGALAALVARQREGGFGMVGSRLVFASADRIQTWGGLTWNLWLGRGRYIGYMRGRDETPDIADIERQIVFVSGASMYVTRAFIEDVGAMDDSYFMFCEDLDWCLSGARHRFGYAHDSIVRHVHGGVSGSSRVRAKRSLFSIYFGERNKVRVARKHLGAWAPLAIGIGLIGTSEHLLRSRSWKQFVTALRGWAAGVRGETGPGRFLAA